MTQGVSVDWQKRLDAVVEDDVRFMLGSRTRSGGGSIMASTMSLHSAAAEELREIAKAALRRLGEMTAVEYGPYVHPELGEEYCVVPTHSDAIEEAAPIVDTVLGVDELPVLDVGEMGNYSSQFYCIVLGEGSGIIGLVRKINPKQALRKGRRFFRYADCLVPAEAPSLMLDEEVDIVVTSDVIAVVRPYSFEVLAREISFSEEYLKGYLDSLNVKLQGVINLTTADCQLLLEAGKAKVSYVKRFRAVGKHLENVELDVLEYNSAIDRYGLDSGLKVGSSGGISLHQGNLGGFLDLIEGRLFRRDFTNDDYRADRLRRLH